MSKGTSSTLPAASSGHQTYGGAIHQEIVGVVAVTVRLGLWSSQGVRARGGTPAYTVTMLRKDEDISCPTFGWSRLM